MTQKWMISMLDTSMAMGLAFAVIRIFLSISGKRYSARCRKRIWIFMAVCFLAPFSLLRFPGACDLKIPNVVLYEFKGQASEHRMTGEADGITGGNEQQSQPIQNETAGSPSKQAEKTNLTVADVLFAVWIIVAVALTVYYAESYRRMRSKIRRWSSRCEEKRVQEIFSELAAECGLKKLPEIRIMKDPDIGPFTTGVLKNVIILPDKSLHEKDLRFILKHELIHCKNRDVLWGFFFLAVNVLYWFNLFAWFLRKAADEDTELACDEAVVSGGSWADRKEYSDVIMSWVEQSRCTGGVISTGYVHGVKFLKRRFESIFCSRKKNGTVLAGVAFALVLLSGGVFHIQSGGDVYAARKIPIDYGIEVRTDADGDGKMDKVFVTDNVSGDYAFTQTLVEFSDGEVALVNYPDYWSSYIATGDLSGDGAADVAVMRISTGSAYGGGEVSVLHTGTDNAGQKTIIEYPSNFIPNPDLELKWVGWEDYEGEEIPNDAYSTAQPQSFDPDNMDFSCVGAAMIEKDGKTMLRLIAFVDAWTESVKCIDCTWQGDGWFIEDMQMVYNYWGGGWEDKLLGGIL